MKENQAISTISSERGRRGQVNKHPGIIGTKLGMAQVFTDDGTMLACTVVQGGCVVVGKRTEERDGYSALMLGLGERKRKHTSKAVATAFEKVGQKPPRQLRELRLSAEEVAGYELGQQVKVEDVFVEGQLVDVQATSKGRGFAGVMKRHNFAGSKASHGVHEWHRHGGSIGTNMTPGRVLPGIKMAGQLGNTTTTVLSQRVAKIDADKQLVFIEGSVPGAPSTLVRIQGAVKKKGGKPKG